MFASYGDEDDGTLMQTPVFKAELTKGLFSYPHVDHNPLHDSPDAKENGEKPVNPQTTFAGDKAHKGTKDLIFKKHHSRCQNDLSSENVQHFRVESPLDRFR